MILLIDNYDSFSFNLYQLLGQFDPHIQVVRNDERTVREIERMKPSHIVISPGPGRPSSAGICEELIQKEAGKIPLLGVCLGHQAICEVFGGIVTYAKKLMHGKQSWAHLAAENSLFQGLPEKVEVGRYHSLAVEPDTLPSELSIIAETDEHEVMAVAHREFPLYGLQFHPESILTPMGPLIIENFLKIQ